MIMMWNKTVTLNDWEDRTYDISLTASLKDTDGVILKDITNVAVRDYIDNRFNIIDDEGNIVITDAEYAKNHSGYVCISQAGINTASGGNIGYDEEKNMIYVEWLDQTVTSLATMLIYHQAQCSRRWKIWLEKSYQGQGRPTLCRWQ